MLDQSQTPTKSLAQLRESTLELPPVKISEVVLQTSNYEAMRSWYEAVLGKEWSIVNTPSKDRKSSEREGDGGKQVHASDVRCSFMFLDRTLPYGQMFAIFEIPSVGKEPTTDPGLNHMQFKHAGVPALLDRVRLLKQAGMHPHRGANHGPITSFYYRDPDRNIVELCSNNYDTEESFYGYFKSEAFKANPSGIDIDRDEFLARFDSGIPVAELINIPVKS